MKNTTGRSVARTNPRYTQVATYQLDGSLSARVAFAGRLIPLLCERRDLVAANWRLIIYL